MEFELEININCLNSDLKSKITSVPDLIVLVMAQKTLVSIIPMSYAAFTACNDIVAGAKEEGLEIVIYQRIDA